MTNLPLFFWSECVTFTKARFPLSEFTGRLDGAFFDTRVDGPSWQVSKNAPDQLADETAVKSGVKNAPGNRA